MGKIDENKIQMVVNLYNEGKSNSDIAKIMNISPNTVCKYLKINGITHKRTFDRLTEDERLDICELYLNNQWDIIFQKYKFMTKNKVYHLVSELGVKKDSYFWSKEDEKILVDNYGKPYAQIEKIMNGRHSCNAIKTKAIKMGLTTPQEWTEYELKILKKYYSVVSKEDFLKMLPNRTEASIICKAMQLGIKSYKYLNEKYSNEDKEFIKNNYGIMTDKEIANILGKTPCGIKGQRQLMGLLYTNKDYSGYINFSKFFRGHLQEWKNKSMEQCNYKCILTGSKNYIIHHLYGFNMIMKETFDYIDLNLNMLKSDNLHDYSKEELDLFLEVFIQIHNKYPLGICVDKNIHNLFHQIYGSGGNTESQWNKFVEDFKNHKYDIESIA